nr:PIG-L family deacetylase [Candidatus Sigynarchaeota archaeon]
MAKFTFFQAHPDDLELNCGHLMHFLTKESKKRHEVKIVSTTKGEFGLADSSLGSGTKYDKFKGDFLAKVRTQELYNAQAIHGIPPENITFLDYVDGFVPFDKKFISKIAAYLQAEKPDVIIGPEPIFTYYYHTDHTFTGRALFYIIHHELIDFTPKLLYYTSLNPNFFFGFKKSDFSLTTRLIQCHKTQFWLLNTMMLVYKPIARIMGKKLPGWKYAEGYRQVFFDENLRWKNAPSRKTAIFSHFFSSMPFFKAKYPEAMLKDLKAKGKI